MAEFTVAAPPPSKMPRVRFSMWEELFDECRAHPGEWRRTKNEMKKTTASQLSSDIRNAYRRNFQKSRLKGLRKDEVWDSAWGEIDGKYYLWIKYVGPRDAEEKDAPTSSSRQVASATKREPVARKKRSA